MAAGILQGRVFRLAPSVPSTANGDASESLLSVVGRQIYSAFDINAAYFAVSNTLPPPKPIITLISSMHTLFATDTASSKSAFPIA